jgi:DNA repair and recombination protein RAD54B
VEWNHLYSRLTTGNIGPDVLEEGAQLNVGNKELQIDRTMQPSEYLSGSCFGRGGIGETTLPRLTNSTMLSKQFIPLKPVALNPSSVRLPSSREASIPPKKVIELEPITLLSRPVAPSSKAESEGDNDAQSYWTANW